MRDGGPWRCCRMAISGYTLPDSLTRQSLSLADHGTPARECIHLSRRQCKSPSYTCCPRSPAGSKHHDSPTTAIEVPGPVSNLTCVGRPRETCPETAPQATGHQRARCAFRGAWRRIPQASTVWLIRSIRRRCVACLAANGGPTCY